MRALVLTAFAPLLINVAAATTLTVPAHTEYTITAQQAELALESLVIGDGARLRLAPGVETWYLSARRAEIGEGVVIDASGAAGDNGSPGSDREGQAGNCKDGRAGGNGGNGSDGGDGRGVHLNLGLAALGSLKVITDGGAGGSGGKGGHGERGGALDHCRGGAGGDGGAGGRGGDGGDAGTVTVNYWDPAGKRDMSAFQRKITVSAAPGRPGRGGAGGEGGSAEEGQYQKGGFAGGRKWLAGGKPGATGSAGAEGAAGSAAAVQVVENMQHRLGKLAQRLEQKTLPASDTDVTVSLQQKVEALQAELRELRQRVQTLEAAVNKK